MIISREKPEMCKCNEDNTNGKPYCQSCGLPKDRDLPENVTRGFVAFDRIL